MKAELPVLDPPERLLCGPGPTNVDPSVLEAMDRPMLGHLDPDFHDILLDVVDLLRRVYRAPEGIVMVPFLLVVEANFFAMSPSE